MPINQEQYSFIDSSNFNASIISLTEAAMQKKKDFMILAENRLLEIFGSKDELLRAVSENRIKRVIRLDALPLEEEIWVDNRLFATFNVVMEGGITTP